MRRLDMLTALAQLSSHCRRRQGWALYVVPASAFSHLLGMLFCLDLWGGFGRLTDVALLVAAAAPQVAQVSAGSSTQ